MKTRVTELLLLALVVSGSNCTLPFTSLPREMLQKMSPYRLSDDCFNDHICRESHYFRLEEPVFPQQTGSDSSNQVCEIDELYVTLGDKFLNKQSPSLYRLGFRVSSLDCLAGLEIKIFEVSAESGKLSRFQQEESLYEEERRIDDQKRQFYMRHYSFHGVFKGQAYDIDRFYVFTDLFEEQLPDPGYFGYSFEMNSIDIKGPFIFESKVTDYLYGRTENLEVISFGDHDLGKNGSVTVNELNSEDAVDLYLLLGDYAYDIHDENGEKGRLYFNEMEPTFASQPVLMIAGNHEYFDYFAFFYAKLTFPGDPYLGDAFLFTGPDKDYSFGPDLISENMQQDLNARDSGHSYHVIIRDIFILTVNMDLILSQNILFTGFIERLSRELEELSEFNHKLFVTHRPLYCSQVGLFTRDCIANNFFLEPLNELLNYHDFNLFMMAHVHCYERMIPLMKFTPIYKMLIERPQRSILSLAPQNTFRNTRVVTSVSVISGSAGSDHLFDHHDVTEIEYLMFTRQTTPGFNSLSFYTLNGVPLVLVRFIPSSSHPNLLPVTLRRDVPGVFEHHSPLDAVIVLGVSSELRQDSKLLLFLLCLTSVLILTGLLYFCRNRHKKSKKEQSQRIQLPNNYDEVNGNVRTSMMDDDQSKNSGNDIDPNEED